MTPLELRQKIEQQLAQLFPEQLSLVSNFLDSLQNTKGLDSHELLPVPSGETFDPITPLIGTLHLGTTDLAENHDDYVDEALEQELNSGE